MTLLTYSAVVYPTIQPIHLALATIGNMILSPTATLSTSCDVSRSSIADTTASTTTQSSRQPAANGPTPPQPVVKVLLIDDQPMVAEAISRLVEDAPDIEFYYCSDVQQAVPMAMAISPTVILQDLVMPDTDGLMLVKFLRANPATQTIPVIVLSTQEEAEIKAEAFASGANDYLVKIPDSIELVARLRYHSTAYTNLLKSQTVDATLAYNEDLERRVAERTAELEVALERLKQTQTQLIQDEKMASLGQLVAGIAHEINNPVTFIHGNIGPAHQYAKDLIDLIALYQAEYPQPSAAIQEEIDDLDLEFLIEDFTKLLNSLMVGTERIQDIVNSLRNFSRLDEAEMKRVDVHEGLDSTLLILRSKLDGIEVIRDYGTCPFVACFPSQLNQVFMNLLANAADALRDSEQSLDQTAAEIRIQTESLDHHSLQVTISDNGPGMDEVTRQRIFDPFFTTKPVGKGTGLGLSISYQIVTERHGGMLECRSTFGEGTAFVVTIPIAQPETEPS